MSTRQLTVLGTASQAPTRTRAGGGYALRWDDQLILFDPAEGFQRQCLFAGVAIAKATAVCITHLHGDHCMGLPGIIQRRALSQRSDSPLPVFFPAASAEVFDHLMHSSIYDDDLVVPTPISSGGKIARLGDSTLSCQRLEHGVPTIGYRVQEPTRLRLNAALLHELGVRGRAVGDLVRDGAVTVHGRRVDLEAVTSPRRGQAMAFVMDTSLCEGAFDLARDADLLVCEATYLNEHQMLAERGHHMTARQAAWLAREAGAGRLVLTHFSGRYTDTSPFATEAGEVFDDVVAVRDLDIVEVPHRAGLPSRLSAWSPFGDEAR